jgi:hypothetical protein
MCSPVGSRQVEPHIRGNVVLFDAPTIKIQKPEVVLSVGVPFICGLKESTERLRVISGNAPALFVHYPYLVLRY